MSLNVPEDGAFCGVLDGVLDTRVASSDLLIDRPRSAAHPRYPDAISPLDYGALAGTYSGEPRSPQQVDRGSLHERRISTVGVTRDRDKRDGEMKLLLDCTPDEEHMILACHRSGAQSALLAARPEP